MPRLRSKVFSIAADGDDSIEIPTSKEEKKSRKINLNENNDNTRDSFSVSKLENEKMLTDESSIELVSLKSPNVDDKTMGSSTNEDEISTKNNSKQLRKRNRKAKKCSDSKESGKENTKSKYSNRKQLRTNSENTSEILKNKQKSRKSINSDDSTENEQTDDINHGINTRQLRSRRKSTVNDSRLNFTAEQNKLKKRRSLGTKILKNNSLQNDSDKETKEYEKPRNIKSKTQIGRDFLVEKGTDENHKHFDINSDNNADLDTTGKVNNRRLEIDYKSDGYDDIFETIEPERNRKSITDRRSTKIHERTIENIESDIQDEGKKPENIDEYQQTINVTYSAEKKAGKKVEKKTDTTYSPKSPKFKHQDTFTPPKAETPISVNERSGRNSKYLTSTPFMQSSKQLPKSVSKKITPKNKTFLNQTPGNYSLIDLTSFTPRSIIKKRRSFQNSQKQLENNEVAQHITVRKKRSLSEIDLTSSVKKSRVTFHPNTSVFQIGSLDSTLDDSEISYNVHSTSLCKENVSKRSIDFVLINPLNDTYEMENFADLQPASPIEGARLSIKSNTPEICGVHKLDETFSPEKDITSRIKKREVKPLTTESSAVKKKVYKKTPMRSATITSSLSSSLRPSTSISTGTKNDTAKKLNIRNSIKKNNEETPKKINESTNFKQNTKGHVLSSLRKTPSDKNQPTPKKGTSTKKMPDFASIHKRNFEKMESLLENVQKRADRAKKLFSVVPETGNKTISTITLNNKPTKVPIPATGKFISKSASKAPNSSTPTQNLPRPINRFGFGIQNTKEKKEIQKEEIKKKQVIRDVGTIRQKGRQYVKGVRSNRRFDLLMQSRDCK